VESECPDESPGLTEVGLRHSVREIQRRSISTPGSSLELFGRIVDAQIETGTPYILFKDAANSRVIRRILDASNR
jgi:ribonucleotide reductase alpha subunit